MRVGPMEIAGWEISARYQLTGRLKWPRWRWWLWLWVEWLDGDFCEIRGLID